MGNKKTIEGSGEYHEIVIEEMVQKAKERIIKEVGLFACDEEALRRIFSSSNGKQAEEDLRIALNGGSPASRLENIEQWYKNFPRK